PKEAAAVPATMDGRRRRSPGTGIPAGRGAERTKAAATGSDNNDPATLARSTAGRLRAEPAARRGGALWGRADHEEDDGRRQLPLPRARGEKRRGRGPPTIPDHPVPERERVFPRARRASGNLAGGSRTPRKQPEQLGRRHGRRGLHPHETTANFCALAGVRRRDPHERAHTHGSGRRGLSEHHASNPSLVQREGPLRCA
ncbi:OTUD4, partial [Symbiodinium sp. CCMP2592]